MPAIEKAPTTLEYLKNKSVRTNFLISTQLFIAVSVSYYIMNFQLKYLPGGMYVNQVIIGVAELIGIFFSGIIY
jgi:FtsH-binding integral membrane protein